VLDDDARTQWGFFLVPAFLVCAVVAVSIMATGSEMSTVSTIGMVGFGIALLGVVLMFSRIEVTVNAGQVLAAFLFGWPHREIMLEDVTAVREVRNRWIQGWGIRKISGGWMYNVWGLDAVELELSSRKVFRIGTNDPGNLFAALSLQAS
jgi:hypothetical protein